MGRENISIYEIAREAKVSPATVSRVLTGNARVSDEKRTRVERLIERYDFKPNAMARSLSNTRTGIIGFLVPDIRNPFYATMAVACEWEANERGYSLMLGNYLSSMELQEKKLYHMLELRVDALIISGGKVDEMASDEEYVSRMNQIADRIPVVITGKLEGSDCYQVSVDEKKAADEIVEYLIRCGHEKIFLVGGRKDVRSTYAKRVSYRDCLRKHGIEFLPQNIIETKEYSVECGFSVMNEIFDRGSALPTAVIAVNDFMAMGIMQSIRQHGLSIPQDISVVSFDDTYIAQSETPRLTSSGYQYSLFGRTLIDTAIAAVEGREVPKLQLLPPKLVIRESSR